MRRTPAALVLALLALAATGCGVAKTVKATVDPVAQAAARTAKVPGYRIAATMRIDVGSTSVNATLNGAFDRTNRSGAMRSDEAVLGHKLAIVEKFSGLTFYMQASGLPGADKLTGGKPWIKYDMSQVEGSLGVSSMPTTGTDPSQFVDYLRAVSSSTKKVGTGAVRGVPTTHYHAVIDLDRYAKLHRAGSTQSIKTLESAIGGHTIPMDAWIDAHKLVRRVQFAFPECVSGRHLHMSMTMDLFDYGPQATPTMPAASQTYDLTPMMRAAMKNVKLGGCSA